MDDGTVLPFADAIRIYHRMRAYPDYRLYCALCEETIVGVFALLIMDNIGHLGKPSAIMEDVIVDERWRGKGIGSQMVTWAIARSREKGCYKLSLSSNKDRQDAHRLYENLGFTRHGHSFAVILGNEGKVKTWKND
jgi:GNAT superfamily N-acetyltransferase